MGNPKQQRPNRVWHFKTFLRWGGFKGLFTSLWQFTISTNAWHFKKYSLAFWYSRGNCFISHILQKHKIVSVIISVPILTKLHRKIGEKVKIPGEIFWQGPAGGLLKEVGGVLKICFLILCDIPEIPSKQSSTIYIQMNFCGSYSFVCEYGLLLRSDCHPKVSGNPGIFYSTKCAAMREILKNKDMLKRRRRKEFRP